MSIIDFVKENDNVQLVINANDLRKLFIYWQEEANAELAEAKTVIKPSDDGGLLTSKEVQKKLRVSATMLWKLEREKKLTPMRIGRRVFYRNSDIDDFIEKNKGQ